MMRLSVVALAICGIVVVAGAQTTSRDGATPTTSAKALGKSSGVVVVGDGMTTIDGTGEVGIVVDNATITVTGIDAKQLADLYRFEGFEIAKQEGKTTVLKGTGSMWPKRIDADKVSDDSLKVDPNPLLGGEKPTYLKVTVRGHHRWVEADGTMVIILKGQGTVRSTTDGTKWGKPINWPTGKVQTQAMKRIGG